MDSIAVRANGTIWALNLEDHKSELRRLQNREQPELLAGSPPSDDFSSLLNASLKPEDINAMRTQKIEPQIITCVQACKLQVEVQKHFIHAHTKNFTSWRMPEVQSLASEPRVYSFVGPTYRWSMKAWRSNNKGEFVRKETRWPTSSKETADVPLETDVGSMTADTSA